MTNKELIEILSKQKANDTVLVSINGKDYLSEIEEVEIRPLKKQKKNLICIKINK